MRKSDNFEKKCLSTGLFSTKIKAGHAAKMPVVMVLPIYFVQYVGFITALHQRGTVLHITISTISMSNNHNDDQNRKRRNKNH